MFENCHPPHIQANKKLNFAIWQNACSIPLAHTNTKIQGIFTKYNTLVNFQNIRTCSLLIKCRFQISYSRIKNIEHNGIYRPHYWGNE